MHETLPDFMRGGELRQRVGFLRQWVCAFGLRASLLLSEHGPLLADESAEVECER